MEGKATVRKSVILGVLLILGLVVLQQVQVEAFDQICCKNWKARNCFIDCNFKSPDGYCASLCNCVITDKSCPGDYPGINLFPRSGKLPDAIEYCNFGCRSSVCDSITTVGGSEELKPAVERCGDACASFCNGDAGIASVAT